MIAESLTLKSTAGHRCGIVVFGSFQTLAGVQIATDLSPI